MGMNLTVYAGPCIVIPKDSAFELAAWESLVCDGRGEAGAGEQDWILVPNREIPGMSRREFGRYENQNVALIGEEDIRRELVALSGLARDVIAWCTENQVPFRIVWGVVPCLM